MHRSDAGLPHRNSSSGRTVVLLLPSAVDCDAFALWLRHRVDCDSIDCNSNLDKGLEMCRKVRPRLLAVDPAIHPAAIAKSTTLLRQQLIEHLLLLDQWPVEVRLADILSEKAASYFSRTAPPHLLASAVAQILETGERAFDPSLAPRVRLTSRGLEFDHSPEARAIVLLSEREKQVLVLLAQGRTVRACAAELNLSESTIDNHKSRLMKKMGVHKSSELTMCALRQGLIAPFK